MQAALLLMYFVHPGIVKTVKFTLHYLLIGSKPHPLMQSLHVLPSKSYLAHFRVFIELSIQYLLSNDRPNPILQLLQIEEDDIKSQFIIAHYPVELTKKVFSSLQLRHLDVTESHL